MRDAKRFAIEAHADQVYGDEPYSVHLEAVVTIVRDAAPDDAIAEAVAWLHDVVEDTPVGVAEIESAFGEAIATAVASLSDPPGRNRRERKALLHEHLRTLDADTQAHRVTLLVKAADRLANVRACAASGDGRLGMYRTEHAAFRTAAHRPGLCDAVWAELDDLLSRDRDP
jgi:(p)ppGpp synthase/HD superfamily hydrolase